MINYGKVFLIRNFSIIFLLLVLLASIVLGALLYNSTDMKSDQRKKYTEGEPNTNYNTEIHRRKLRAFDLATQFVKATLLEPATSLFPSTKDKLSHIKYLGNNKFQIDSWVESQDTYGAITRRIFRCILVTDGTGVVKKELSIEEVGYIPYN